MNIKKKPKPTFDLYIGRANKWLELEESKWGNPFHLKCEKDRPMVLRQYLEHILHSEELLAALSELDGLTLGCYCAPKWCHGNLLIELRLLQIADQIVIENGVGRILSMDSLPERSAIRFCLGV